ncbi:MAG: hypothetical protein ACE5KM_12910 [Planctomycetaceae bacterium]
MVESTAPASQASDLFSLIDPFREAATRFNSRLFRIDAVALDVNPSRYGPVSKTGMGAANIDGRPFLFLCPSSDVLPEALIEEFERLAKAAATRVPGAYADEIAKSNPNGLVAEWIMFLWMMLNDTPRWILQGEPPGFCALDPFRASVAAIEILQAEEAGESLTLLARFPTTETGHLEFLEFVRDEVHGAAEAKRQQIAQKYSNDVLASMVKGIKWWEARERVKLLFSISIAGEAVARVLRLELTVGTVEQIDELLTPAVRALRQAWEDRRTDVTCRPASRSRYLGSILARPPSQTTADERGTLEFRCGQLDGMVKLYHYALDWSLRRKPDDSRDPRNRFVLHAPELWVLGIETVYDAARANWDGISESVCVAEATASSEDSGQRCGSIRLKKVQWDADFKSLTVVSDTSNGGPDDPALVFSGTDLVRSATFLEVPWLTIGTRLERAYTNAEEHLKAEGIRWNGPPWFGGCRDSVELERDIATRNLKREEVLLNLEKHCRDRVEDIETVLRGAVQGTTPTSQVDDDADVATVVFHGNHCYSVGDGEPLRLDDNDSYVLQSFLDAPAQNKAEIEKKAGVPRPHEILKRLTTKYNGVFRTAIRLPGGKGKGGYRVTIRRAQ